MSVPIDKAMFKDSCGLAVPVPEREQTCPARSTGSGV